ncbi:hypothetical protein FRB90_004996 [Tulasnella sp. 427]|nr:hypothetical protein FRB90_004996 [Tulasnella sp. 427]
MGKKQFNSPYEHLMAGEFTPFYSPRASPKLMIHTTPTGATSGFCSTIVLQPLDLVKTRVQQSYDSVHGSPRGAIAVSRQVVAHDGLLGLWRGTTPTLYRNVPGVAMYFYALQVLRHEMTKVPGFAVYSADQSSSSGSALPKLSSTGNLISGATARVSVGFILNPFTVVKARFESDHYAYRSMREAVSSIWREAGPRGLLQGFQASVLRDAPYAGLYVLFYEAIKEQTGLLLGSSLPGLKPFVYSYSGAMAGALATLSTHPFDVMKTRMQVQSSDAQYRSLSRTMVGIFKERGLMGFFDGVSIRISRKVFSSAISWTVYETLLIFWRDRARYA